MYHSTTQLGPASDWTGSGALKAGESLSGAGSESEPELVLGPSPPHSHLAPALITQVNKWEQKNQKQREHKILLFA